MERALAIKGNFIFAKDMNRFEVYKDQILISVDGKVEGIYESLPAEFGGLSVEDWDNRLIIPGFVDLHVHAPQFLQMGLGMNKHLLEWLKDYTFDLEARYADLDFARQTYRYFADALAANGTLHACVFATSSTTATEVLFEAIKKAGIGAYVGKVNMDQNGPETLIESADESMRGTLKMIKKYMDEPLVKPIITPRFAPSCSRELMDGLGRLAKEHQVPVQSHVGETEKEVEWVRELFPDAKHYLDVYGRSGLLDKAVMAHAIYLTEDEIRQMKEQDVMIAHCPDSNINIRSGIMPARRYLKIGLKIGLGSDVAGGHRLAINDAMIRAIQLSKLVEMEDPDLAPLSLAEAFYMGTKGGGQFFGMTGSFEPGYDFDALVIEDHPLVAEVYSIEERLEKFVYSGCCQDIAARYMRGRKI